MRRLWGGGGIAPDNEASHSFEATTFTLLGDLVPERNESVFQFWDKPGKYWVSVVDRDNGLESSKLAITLVDPPIAVTAAANLFRSGGVDIWLAFRGSEEGKRGRSVLKELGNAHPGTVYGRYANAIICLRDADPRLRFEVAKIADFDSAQLFKRLKHVVESFDPGHPMRSQALFRMAGLQAESSVRGDANVTMQQLLRECSDSSWTKEAQDWLAGTRKRRAIRGN